MRSLGVYGLRGLKVLGSQVFGFLREAGFRSTDSRVWVLKVLGIITIIMVITAKKIMIVIRYVDPEALNPKKARRPPHDKPFKAERPCSSPKPPKRRAPKPPRPPKPPKRP